MTVEKHIRVRGSSNISWKDAIVQTISEASKTINYISEVKVIDQTANIQDGKITEYFAEIELTFYIVILICRKEYLCNLSRHKKNTKNM